MATTNTNKSVDCLHVDVHEHRDLKDVSVALLATCLPLPSLSFAFCNDKR
jgi:hypothetical protein